MKTSPRSRRHRNPPTQEVQNEQQPFFSRSPGNAPGVQARREAFFQPKLVIGQANDHFEREADAVAEKVVGQGKANVGQAEKGSVQRLATPEEKGMPATNDGRMAEDKQIQEKQAIQRTEVKEEKPEVQKAEAPQKEEEKPAVQKAEMPEQKEEKPEVQKVEAAKEEEKPVQTKARSGGSVSSPEVTAQIERTRGRGKRLPDKIRKEMETAFGRDFSGVNIHTDTTAVELNEELNAEAFAHGKDIYFNTGKFAPDGAEGKKLLAHELTHIVQQNGTK